MRSWRISEPFHKICPEVGWSSPANILTVVDLPDPFGPRYPVTCPGKTENETWSTTARLRYFLVKPRTSNIRRVRHREAPGCSRRAKNRPQISLVQNLHFVASTATLSLQRTQVFDGAG